MQRFSLWITLLVVFTFSASVAAQFVNNTAPLQHEYEAFMEALRGASGASWFVLSLIAVQAMNLLLRVLFAEQTGLTKLFCLAIFSLLATISANILSGKTVVQSVFMDAGSLMAWQVLFHQVKRQWEKREEDRADIVATRGMHDEDPAP